MSVSCYNSSTNYERRKFSMSTLELMLAYRLNKDIEAYNKLMEAFIPPTVNLVRVNLKEGDPHVVYADAFRTVQDAIEFYDVKALEPVDEYMKEFIERNLASYFECKEKEEEVEEENVSEEGETLSAEEVELFEAIEDWRRKYSILTGSHTVDMDLVREVHELTEEQTKRYLHYISHKYTRPNVDFGSIIGMMLRL